MKCSGHILSRNLFVTTHNWNLVFVVHHFCQTHLQSKYEPNCWIQIVFNRFLTKLKTWLITDTTIIVPFHNIILIEHKSDTFIVILIRIRIIMISSAQELNFWTEKMHSNILKILSANPHNFSIIPTARISRMPCIVSHLTFNIITLKT